MPKVIGLGLILFATLCLSAKGQHSKGNDWPDRRLSVFLRVAEPQGGAPRVNVLLKGRALSGPAEGTTTEWLLSAPWSGEIDVPSGLAWSFTAEAEGYWAAETLALPEAESILLELLPLGTLRGRITTEMGDQDPADLLVRFQSTARQFLQEEERANGDVPITSSACPIRDGEWQCRVPAGRLDLRLTVRGFAPVYLWGVRIDAGKTVSLPPLELQRGASVAGWLIVEGGEPGGALVELQPEILQPGLAEQQLQGLTRSVISNERGFFQFVNILPGSYRIRASKSGFAPGLIRGVRPIEGAAAELAEPLALKRPSVVELHVLPAVDPNGTQWVIRLRELNKVGQVAGAEYRSEAEPSGYWRQEGLSAGSYQLSILNSEGSRFFRRVIEVDRLLSPLLLEVPLIPIEGHIRRGSEPLRGEITFEGIPGYRVGTDGEGMLEPDLKNSQTGRESFPPAGEVFVPDSRAIRIRSNEEGLFQGHLTHEGTWKVTWQGAGSLERANLEPVEVRLRPREKTAWIELAIPDSEISGEIVDEQDQPVSGALVAVHEAGKVRPRASMLTGAEGEFSIRGLPEGTFVIDAEYGKLRSEEAVVHVEDEQQTNPLRLVVRAGTDVRGFLVSQSGPIVGASITVIPRSAVPASRSYGSGADGGFRFVVPTAVQGIDLVVVASGFATKILPMKVNRDSEEPHFVEMAAIGGELVIPLTGSGNPLNLRLYHNASSTTLENVLRALMPFNPIDATRGLVLPMMETGLYRLCDARGSCAEGVLEPYGNLELELAPH